MVASEYGYYRSDGIQNTGTAHRSNGNAYIYNSAGQIFPRQITENFSIPEVAGSYICYTLRSGYNGSFHRGSWRTDKAYQGFYEGGEGASQKACGHFFNPSGVKISVGDVIRFDVTYVKITLNRTRGGYSGSTAIGNLRFSNLKDTCGNGGGFLDGRWKDLNESLLNSYSYTFQWNPIGQTTVIEDKGGTLCTFIKNFLTNGDAQTLAIYNGETGPEPYSRNYASCNEFNIYIEGTRTIQL